MSLLCPKYVAARDAAGMDDMADWSIEQRHQAEPVESQPEEKGGDA